MSNNSAAWDDLLSNVSVEIPRVNSTSGTRADCAVFQFVLNTVIIGALCFFGLCGNTVSIIVLHKDKAHRVATFLLQSLAVVDNIFLLISLIALSVMYGFKMKYIAPIVVKYMNPLAYMAQTATIWMTVLLALNRFIAICKPFKTARWCSLFRTRIQVLSVIAFSILFNFPRFFQYNIIPTYSDATNQTTLKLRPTPIAEDTLFGKIYTNALYTILVLLLPLVLLLYLNVRLIRELHAMKRRRRQSTLSHGSTSNSEDNNVTLVMVVIVIIFIVCHTPDRVYQIIWWFSATPACNQHLYYVANISNAFIIINSAVNFVIYYIFRKRFRKVLVATLCMWMTVKYDKVANGQAHLDNGQMALMHSAHAKPV